jgi:hypothetical protein
MLTLALTLALVADAAEFRAPQDKVGCTLGRHTLLGPQQSDSGRVPTNASIWVLENPSAIPDSLQSPELRDSSGGPVNIEVHTTSTRFGLLLQLRPLARLAPNAVYRINLDAQTVDFTTGTGEDMERPTTPQIGETGARDNGCNGLGVEVDFTHDAGNEPMLYLAERSDGALFNLSLTSPIYIPAAQDEEIEAQIIAMDLAGNRSVPSLVIEEQNSEGCACSTSSERSDMLGWMLPAFAFGVWLLVRALTEKRI